MPELPDTMYCSEQICIPPTFPYLLRQYAKAAIRTQPTDLLRWSTAYFRCLSLNLKPPVKPRLEYPIPKSHYGLTPGWLKALLHQLENNITVPFKVLWDRWIGACLEHKNLIEMLCLGGFTNSNAIPWFRFIAICASHLTENLTQTMILICEILTEEPEGGCAMITLETFVDLYRFLAAIDASKPQTLINIYFTDSLLSLYREPVVEKARESVSLIEEEAEEESTVVEEEEMIVAETGPIDDQIGVVISCPDIAPDDYKTEEYFLQMAEEGDEKSVEELESVDTIEQTLPPQQQQTEEDEEDDEEPKIKQEHDESVVLESEKGEKSEEALDEAVDKTPSLHDETTEEQASECLHLEEEEGEGVDDGDKQLEELRKLLAEPQSEKYEGEEAGEKEEELEATRQEIEVEAIPGIGATVSKNLVDAVVKYMEECSKRQHGMVMPRNVRHFNCPPLEVLEY